MLSPSSQRRRSRIIISSPFTGHRRSGRLVVQKQSKCNIKVCIRIRPPNEKEECFRDGKQAIAIIDEQVLVFDPVEIHTPSFHRGRPTKDPTARRNRDIKFGFGCIFKPGATNDDVFHETTKPILDSLMNGVNCSVFAYGATGAGKTFTMLGASTNKGVIARTVDELYERIKAINESTLCEVEVSYLEIYNETVRDLLNPTGNELILRESGEGVAVAGLSFHKPFNVDELFQMLERGNSNRTQHPTDANKESSRSHAVFHIYLKQRDRSLSIPSDVVMSKMALIDLAGSERAAATVNCGARFREGANINKSLLALGNCINALAEGKQGNHIPYRDSKLTRILKDSLGGYCHTVMIAAVSPSLMAYDDTYNTLRYADRAQKIKLEPKSNIYRTERHAHEYEKVVEKLQLEVQQLREKVESLVNDKKRLEKELDANRQVACNFQKTCENEPKSHVAWLKEKYKTIDEAVHRYMRVQNALLDLESQKNILQLKLQHRQRCIAQLSEVQWDDQRQACVRARWEKFQGNCHSRIEQLTSQIGRCTDELKAVKTTLHGRLWQHIGLPQLDHPGNGDADDENGIFDDLLHGRIELCQTKSSEKHLKALVDCLNARVDQQDRSIETMGSLMKELYLLQSYGGHVPQSLRERFENIEKQLEGGKEVSWSDQNEITRSSQLSELTDLTFNASTAGASAESSVHVNGGPPVNSLRSFADFPIHPSVNTIRRGSRKHPHGDHTPHRLKRQAASSKDLRHWHY